MMIEKHDLLHELPEHRERIHQLKLENDHFAKLFAQYHEHDHEVRRMEMGIETVCDETMEDAKKKRLHLKDQLYQMILAEQ